MSNRFIIEVWAHPFVISPEIIKQALQEFDKVLFKDIEVKEENIEYLQDVDIDGNKFELWNNENEEEHWLKPKGWYFEL